MTNRRTIVSALIGAVAAILGRPAAAQQHEDIIPSEVCPDPNNQRPPYPHAYDPYQVRADAYGFLLWQGEDGCWRPVNISNVLPPSYRREN